MSPLTDLCWIPKKSNYILGSMNRVHHSRFWYCAHHSATSTHQKFIKVNAWSLSPSHLTSSCRDRGFFSERGGGGREEAVCFLFTVWLLKECYLKDISFSFLQGSLSSCSLPEASSMPIGQLQRKLYFMCTCISLLVDTSIFPVGCNCCGAWSYRKKFPHVT